MKWDTDSVEYQELIDELNAIRHVNPPVHLELNVSGAMQLVAFLQLALRHPRADEHEGAKYIRELANRLIVGISPPGSRFRQMLIDGFDVRYDVVAAPS